MGPQDRIRAAIEESVGVKQRLLERCLASIADLAAAGVRCVRGGGKILLCGNGGSACDAAHAAGELVGWFARRERRALPAIALGHEVPSLTAIANDEGFEEVFARQLAALGRPEDLLIGISTSGRSRNVVRALEVAKELGMATAALASERGGPVAELADVAVRVPSTDTARIQESHLLCLHVLCEAVERECG